MPRARTDESNDVVLKKPRAPRTRLVSINDRAAVVVPRKRAPRRTAAKELTDSETVATEPEAESSRKAPTALSRERKQSVRSSRLFVVVATFCILLIGAGVVVGMFDHGPIDVLTVVTNRNEKIARGEVRDENGQVITVPVSAAVLESAMVTE